MTGGASARRLRLREKTRDDGLDQPADRVAGDHVNEHYGGGLAGRQCLELGGHHENDQSPEDEPDVAGDDTGVSPGACLVASRLAISFHFGQLSCDCKKNIRES